MLAALKITNKDEAHVTYLNWKGVSTLLLYLLYCFHLKLTCLR